jgi:hypothetical protein
MASNGERRAAMNRRNHPLPSIGKVMGQGGDTLGAAGSVPDIGSVMRQGRQRNGESGIPTIQKTLRQGGGNIK